MTKKTALVTKLENLNFDKTQKLKVWQNSKTQFVTKKLQILTKPKNSNFEEKKLKFYPNIKTWTIPKLKLWPNSKSHIVTKLKNLNGNKTKKTWELIELKTKIITKLKKILSPEKKLFFWQVFWTEQLDTSTTDEMYSGQPFVFTLRWPRIFKGSKVGRKL